MINLASVSQQLSASIYYYNVLRLAQRTQRITGIVAYGLN